MRIHPTSKLRYIAKFKDIDLTLPFHFFYRDQDTFHQRQALVSPLLTSRDELELFGRAKNKSARDEEGCVEM
jgi:hypothetical protein